jgi:hypothetical protein
MERCVRLDQKKSDGGRLSNSVLVVTIIKALQVLSTRVSEFIRPKHNSILYLRRRSESAILYPCDRAWPTLGGSTEVIMAISGSTCPYTPTQIIPPMSFALVIGIVGS